MLDVELDPKQPAAVVRAVKALMDAARPPVDPWWAAGLASSLEADAQSDVIARPRRTRGADRA